MGWKTKFIFLCIIYIAGFATAAYLLAPEPENSENYSRDTESRKNSFEFKEFEHHNNAKSEEFVHTFNASLHQFVEFGKDAAIRVSQFLKQKWDERQESQHYY